jgi:hypothetical protein
LANVSAPPASKSKVTAATASLGTLDIPQPPSCCSSAAPDAINSDPTSALPSPVKNRAQLTSWSES